MDGDVESHTTEVASASSAGAVGDSRQPPTTPSPTRELLRATPAHVPQAQTPSPELIQVRLKDEPASFILYFITRLYSDALVEIPLPEYRLSYFKFSFQGLG